MARKKKGQLPSGSIRIQRKVGTRPDGSRIMKSFTGKTRAEAEYNWRLYMMTPHEEKKAFLTVQEAVRRYIDSKTAVLSPSTLRTYWGQLRGLVEGSQLGATDVRAVTTIDAQLWISGLAADHSPKSVRNAWALVQSSLEMFVPDLRLRVTLPQKVAPELYCPSDEDVRNLLKYIGETDQELEKAVLLAAFGPLRRSEISALTHDDIRGSMVTISKAMVRDEINRWVVKGTKTTGSARTIRFPDFVIRKLEGSGSGPVVALTPDVITARFRRALKKAGGPEFRFHDLRHYSASIMHAIGIGERYAMARGGWSSDGCYKRVYRNVIDLEEKKQTQKILEHFEAVSHV